jgi:hypothetical protein
MTVDEVDIDHLTGVLHRLPRCRWKDAQVPKLHVLCDAEKDVKRVHLILLFMDYDATSKDDVMGGFSRVVCASNSWRRPLMHHFSAS